MARELDAFAARRGPPETVVSDNGTELTSIAILRWAQERGEVALHRTGKPQQNGFVESFNGRLRDECLTWMRRCSRLRHARVVLAALRQDYNEVRPHSALGRPRTRLDQPAAVLACIKPAGFVGGLRPGSTRLRATASGRVAGTEKRRSTEPRNTVTIGATATADSTFEWREVGAQVRPNKA